MTKTITSDKTETVKILDMPGSFNIVIYQKSHYVEMSIDQAAKVAIEILTHVELMSKKHLK